MIRLTDSAIMSLMMAYVPYFVEDFAMSTLGHLKGSYPIDGDYLLANIQQETAAGLESLKLSVENPNPSTRFLCELATHALTNDLKDPTSRVTYDQIKVLPSSHQDELAAMSYHAAELYQNTLDTTIAGVVVKEANAVSQLIHSQAQERISQTQTGGNIKHFSWGILSDGLWLNKALMRSFEETKVFRPGSDADLGWSRTSFAFAQRNASFTPLGREESFAAQEAFDVLLSNANDTIVNLPLHQNAHSLKDLLFKNNSLTNDLDQYEKGLKHPKAMVEAVSDLTSHVQLIAHLKDVAQQLGPDVVPACIVERLDVVDKVATMALVGFEALRETRFADTLVLYVDAPTADPVVDVFINKDTISSYLAQGGEEEELVKIGNHLDPRNGIYTPTAGWSQTWIAERKDGIIEQVNANETKRLDLMRANDSAVIRDLVEHNLGNLAQSYSEACGRPDLKKDITQQIGRIARGVTQDVALEYFSLETEATKLLCNVIEDPFVTRSAETFVAYANHTDEDKRINAKALTVMSASIADILVNFSKEPV